MHAFYNASKYSQHNFKTKLCFQLACLGKQSPENPNKDVQIKIMTRNYSGALNKSRAQNANKLKFNAIQGINIAKKLK